MKINLNTIILSTAIVLSFCPKAEAGKVGDTRAGLGFSLHKLTSGQNHYSLDDSTSMHVAGLANVRGFLVNWLEADISILYGNVEFSRKNSQGLRIREMGHRVHIPLIFRFHLVNFFSVGMGFYGSYRMGGVHFSQSTPVEERTSAFDTAEHGLEAVLGSTIPLGRGEYSIFFDLRYDFSLTPRPTEEKQWLSLYIGLLQEI